MRIEVTVPDGVSGNWKVSSFSVSQCEYEVTRMRATFRGGRGIVPVGNYKQLLCNGTIIMSNTPDEIRDHISFIRRGLLSKNILINGLGLGMCVTAILESDIVEKITVIEKSEDVIKLVAPTFKDEPRVEIIHADAFTFKPPKGVRYGAIWHDIWTYLCVDNLPEMHKLHRKYGRRTNWQGSWGRGICEQSKRRDQRSRW